MILKLKSLFLFQKHSKPSLFNWVTEFWGTPAREPLRPTPTHVRATPSHSRATSELLDQIDSEPLRATSEPLPAHSRPTSDPLRATPEPLRATPSHSEPLPSHSPSHLVFEQFLANRLNTSDFKGQHGIESPHCAHTNERNVFSDVRIELRRNLCKQHVSDIFLRSRTPKPRKTSESVPNLLLF
jgi:hypothetical protein